MINFSKDSSDDIPSKRLYLEDKSGRQLITFQDGSSRLAPSEVSSQFKIELVRLDSNHVGLVNSAGYYLSALMEELDWFIKSPELEEMFTVKTHGEYEAYKSHNGKYLNINTEGFLELLSVEDTAVTDTQLFSPQNGETSFSHR